MKQAVILAGGKGSRLKQRLNGLPKPMIDIAGKPLIERQILLLKKYNFNDIIILVNYKAEVIESFCNANNNWGLNIKCINEINPLGTAGATINIYDLLYENFLVVYGDTMLDVDLNLFYNFHFSNILASATLFLHPNDHPSDSDLVEINENGLIISFNSYPHDNTKYFQNLVNAALYVIEKKSLSIWKNSNQILDFGKDIFPLLLRNGNILKGYKSFEYIKDCGTPERLDKVSNDFESGKILKSRLDYKQNVIFLDRDGTINKEVNHLSKIDDFELLPNTSSGIKILNENFYRICVITNQPVIARGQCDMNTLKSIHNKMETLIGYEGAFIDEIFFCPHHPQKGHQGEIPTLKIDCDCRKPKIGLLEKASNLFNIDKNNSWLIGDTSTDMMTAYNAGIKSILVETGWAGLDRKYNISPDFICPDLYRASLFITNIYPKIFNDCTPFVNDILKMKLVKVGGLSRTGKTTFANTLKYVLKSFDCNVHVISIDRWIKCFENRGKNVFGRYDVNEIENITSKLLNRGDNLLELILPYYDKSTQTNIENVNKIIIEKDDIVLLEGTICLNILANESHRSINFFVNIDESVRKKRVLSEYQLRGKTEIEANKIYLERLIDEIPFINQNGIKINMQQYFE